MVIAHRRFTKGKRAAHFKIWYRKKERGLFNKRNVILQTREN